MLQDIFAGRRLPEDVVDEFVAVAALALRHVEPAVYDAELLDGMLEAGETRECPIRVDAAFFQYLAALLGVIVEFDGAKVHGCVG